MIENEKFVKRENIFWYKILAKLIWMHAKENIFYITKCQLIYIESIKSI